MDFDVPADHRVKLKESEKRKYLELPWELKKKNGTMKVKRENSCNWCGRYNHQRIGTGPGRLENKRTSGDHQNYSIIKIGQQNWEESWRLEGLVITQNPVRSHQTNADVKKLPKSKIATMILLLVNKYCFNNWLILDMPTRLGLFYASRLKNRVHFMFLFKFIFLVFSVSYTWLCDIKYSYLNTNNLERYIWPIIRGVHWV